MFAGFICGVKMVLPEDVVKKDTKQYEEVTIPASEPPPTTVGKNLVPIETLDDVRIIEVLLTFLLNLLLISEIHFCFILE